MSKYTGILTLFTTALGIASYFSMKAAVILFMCGVLFALFLIAEHLEKIAKK